MLNIEVCENPDCECEFEAGSEWLGESGKVYCSEDCMNKMNDVPDED